MWLLKVEFETGVVGEVRMVREREGGRRRTLEEQRQTEGSRVWVMESEFGKVGTACCSCGTLGWGGWNW